MVEKKLTKRKQWQFLPVWILLCTVGILQGQSAVTAGGSAISDDGGRLSQAIGQLAFTGQSGDGGRFSEGVQRAIAQITSIRDTTICSGGVLPSLKSTGPGGTWLVFSDIGTVVDASGNLSPGTNTTNDIVEDTIVYLFNGYTDTAYVSSKPSLELTCNDLTLETDDEGRVHLDSLAISQGVQSAGGGINSVISPSIPFVACVNGFQQYVSFFNSDGSGCSDSCEVQVTLIDTIQPVPGCEAAIDLVLVWQGLSLYPVTLSGTSVDNCGAENLEFSFSSDFLEPSITLDCREQLGLLDSLQLYMRDQSGNTSICQVLIGYDYLAGEDCHCDWGNLKLKGEIPPDDYKATDYIQASGKITKGDTVLLKAGKYISFKAGFQVDHGSTLMARIDSCGNVPQTFNAPEEEQSFNTVEFFRGAVDKPIDQFSIHSMEVFPNPFSNWFKVQLEMKRREKISFKLYNLQGKITYQLLQEATFETGIQEIMIDGSRLPSGVYILTATNGGEIVRRQVVKMH